MPEKSVDGQRYDVQVDQPCTNPEEHQGTWHYPNPYP
jgi:hypothetical protein